MNILIPAAWGCQKGLAVISVKHNAQHIGSDLYLVSCSSKSAIYKKKGKLHKISDNVWGRS
jgi:hypothetical protein